ncbi:MAG: galactose ABC transporter substrate-binding protein [Oscillospiraceae bacterium]
MKKLSAIILTVLLLFLCAGCNGNHSEGNSGPANPASGMSAGVFYYTYADVYISSVRASMDSELKALGIKYQNYDGNGNQTTQSEQISTAITNGVDLLIVNIVETSSDDAAISAVESARSAGIPIIFFNREVSDAVVSSYDKCAFVGTDAAEAGHMQGEMIANYLLENYDKTDLNGDGAISYVLFKGQSGNAESEYRTRYSVEDCNKILEDNGKSPLAFYDKNNTAGYLVDQSGQWSAAAATNYMDTILSEYSEANNNMVEMVIANNDDMAAGAISSLQTVGYNTGSGKSIPVFGVDAVENARQLINSGKMTGTVMQDSEGMADTIARLTKNVINGDELMANTDDLNVDENVSKIRVPYGIYTG